MENTSSTRHQERLVDHADRGRDVGVHGFHQLQDGFLAEGAGVAFEGLDGAALDDRDIVAGELVLLQQVADFHLDQLKQFGVVDHVHLVHEHDDVGHADLTGEQDVLAGLGHGPVGGGNHQDGSIHLRGAGDHVLDIVGMAGAVDVGVMAVLGLVLDVRGIDGDAALAFFGSVVDFTVGLGDGAAGLGQNRGDGGGQGGLAMVDVADGADVDVRFIPVEFFLGHNTTPLALLSTVSSGRVILVRNLGWVCPIFQG